MLGDIDWYANFCTLSFHYLIHTGCRHHPSKLQTGSYKLVIAASDAISPGDSGSAGSSWRPLLHPVVISVCHIHVAAAVNIHLLGCLNWLAPFRVHFPRRQWFRSSSRRPFLYPMILFVCYIYIAAAIYIYAIRKV